jgi:dipeptidyl-peptidase-4
MTLSPVFFSPECGQVCCRSTLIKANKDFDFLLLPNARHGYGSDSYYIMRRRWDYFVQHLLEASPPKEYLIKFEEDPRQK